MIIQWFPGHMTKALRMMEESVKLVECVIYVLDARAVFSSINPSFDYFIKHKNVVYVLNKADLADDVVSRKWLDVYTQSGKNALLLNGANKGGINALREMLKRINRNVIDAYRAKGVNKTVRCMVIGIPNSGKSTIINSLASSKRAQTGDKAGVTKGKQWVKVDGNLDLLDTPGTLCPSFENESIGLHLGYIGSINDMILDRESLAIRLIEELASICPQFLQARYHVETDGSAEKIFADICKSRGLIMRGGEVDTERGSSTVIDDFRKGRIGRISLERPETANV